MEPRALRTVTTDKSEALDLRLPDDAFYLPIAPFVTQMHDCFHHSLTTCVDKLQSAPITQRASRRRPDHAAHLAAPA